MPEVSYRALAEQEAYTPGLSREFVAERFGVPAAEIAKLGSAENPLGPSPRAMEAIAKAALSSDLYPDWTARQLREAVARKYGLSPENVVCGAGETELISCAIRAFSRPGDPVLMHQPCFPIYHLYCYNEGREPMYVEMGKDFDPAWEKFIAALARRPPIVFLTNPHSPSGRFLAERDIRRVCEAARDSLVVLDEAYIHFTQTPGGIGLVREYPHLLVLRTFSKAFGLAGLRAGIGVGAPDVIKPLLGIKPTWNLGHMQAAGAAAALDDDAHVERTVALVVEMRAYTARRMAGLKAFRMVPDSRSNFFLVEILAPALDSTAVFGELLKRGVIVKDGSVSFRGLGKRFLRVDVSLRQHMDRFVDALADIEARNR